MHDQQVHPQVLAANSSYPMAVDALKAMSVTMNSVLKQSIQYYKVLSKTVLTTE